MITNMVIELLTLLVKGIVRVTEPSPRTLAIILAFWFHVIREGAGVCRR